MTEREEQAVIVLNTLYNNPLLSDIHRQALEVGIMAIKAASSSENQKVGKWVMSVDGLYRPICNQCGAHPWKGYIPTVEEATDVFKYCPNCGSYNGGAE